MFSLKVISVSVTIEIILLCKSDNLSIVTANRPFTKFQHHQIGTCIFDDAEIL